MRPTQYGPGRAISSHFGVRFETAGTAKNEHEHKVVFG